MLGGFLARLGGGLQGLGGTKPDPEKKKKKNGNGVKKTLASALNQASVNKPSVPLPTSSPYDKLGTLN
jgi:hypothetical protein